MPKDNRKQNPKESYTKKYQKHIDCGYGYTWVCINMISWGGKDSVNNFINSMIKESKHCSDVVKKNFSKELVTSKEDNEDFKNSTKCWICDNRLLIKMLK